MKLYFVGAWLMANIKIFASFDHPPGGAAWSEVWGAILGLREAEPGEQRGLSALPLHTVLRHREWKAGLQDLAGIYSDIILLDCFYLNFSGVLTAGCSDGCPHLSLCWWNQTGLFLSSWNSSHFDSVKMTSTIDFRGRPCTLRTGMGIYTTTTLPPRQMVRYSIMNHHTNTNISSNSRLPGAVDNSVSKRDSRELFEQ